MIDDKNNIEKFDLIVIGSGSGLDVANAVFQHGLRVAIVELALIQVAFHQNY